MQKNNLLYLENNFQLAQQVKLELIKQLDKQGYKHKEKIIEDEEYMIITNGISSCAIQIYDDICSLYEIVYDFSMNRYFLMYRNSKKIDDIESILRGINFLINEINLDVLKKVYGTKRVKNKNLKRMIDCQYKCNTLRYVAAKTSVGVLYPRHLRGLLFIIFTITSSSF